MDHSFLFYLLLIVIAFLYASIGHGGASGYIALMVIFSFPAQEIRSNALVLNIAVSLVAFQQYNKVQRVKLQIALPLFLTSIPMAYIGGSLAVHTYLFNWLLALALLASVLRLCRLLPETCYQKQPKVWMLLLSGAVLGFLSGLLGIGGGVLLTPVLILASWTSLRQAATISSLFIAVNSLAGLLGLLNQKVFFTSQIVFMLAAALIGGSLGAYCGSQRYSLTVLKRLVVVVLITAALKLIWA